MTDFFIPSQRGPSEDYPGDSTPLREAREWLSGEAENGGTRCPCCSQYAKVYKRLINHSQVRSMAIMYMEGGTDFVRLPVVVDAKSREEGKLRYWGLLQEQPDKREDGGRRGFWRVTDRGVAFLHGDLWVQKYAHVYDSELVGFSGPLVSVEDCVKERFNLAELMSR